MNERTQSTNTLPANRSFIIQFRPAAANGRARCEGRVEHLASGHAENFSTQAELWRILEQLLPGKQTDQTH